MATRHRSRRSNGASPTVTAPTPTRPLAPTGGRGAQTAPASSSSRPWRLLGSGALVATLAVVVGWAVLANQGGGGASGVAEAPGTSGAPSGTIVRANGGQWTNITPDALASMMTNKDVLLLNVKTPYIGEIAGTDLYIPYTDVAARAAELPNDKTAQIVVYCRTGHESAIAAQTLLDLGYTNILNLDGGMTAWTASGRQLVQVNRS